jgi:hypothetical protein
MQTDHMGRPTNYSEELAAQVCNRLSAGEPLTKICSDEDMPGRSTVCAWRHAHPEFQANYARAREDAGDVWAERALQAALSATPETAQAARVRFDALRWYASKLAPKVYGDRLEHVGKITHQIDVVRMSDAALLEIASANTVIANGEDDEDADQSPPVH